MATLYILHSEKLKRYYTGSCKTFDERWINHQNHVFKKSFTSKTDDWKVYLKIDDLEYFQARNVERHIKKMKSKKYIENLKLVPDLQNKLVEKYNLNKL